MTATARLLKAGMELDAVPQLLLAALELDHHPVPARVVENIHRRSIRAEPKHQHIITGFFL